MNHGYERTIRSGHHVDGLIGLAQGLLQHNHGEAGSTCTHVTRTLLHGVGGYHARTCIAFGRTERTTGFQVTRDVETLCTVFGQRTCILSGREALRQDVLELPAVTLGSDESIELLYHLCIVGLGSGIHGNHT